MNLLPEDLNQIENAIKKNRQWKTWQKVVSVLSCIVVFCTTYIMILPALTLQSHYYCGKSAHTHGDSCYETKLICDIPESEGHTHSDTCYQIENELVCGMEEMEETEETEERDGHKHDKNCYKEKKTLVCNLKEEEGHTHGKDCYERILICKEEEHKHSRICESNPEADAENAHDWEATLPKEKEYTGNWKEDVIRVAESQLNYKESKKNFQIEEGEEKGYTRYGAWYGIPYGDWCAMFASFCIYYAGIDGKMMPMEASCDRWIELLSRKQYQLYHSGKSYQPQRGDLIFFNWDGKKDAEHVGLVVEVKKDKEGNIKEIKTIEGNSSDMVRYNSYGADDKKILGYAQMPQNPHYVEERAEESSEAAGNEAEAAEETASTEAEIAEHPMLKTVDHNDYTVTVSYTSEAEIPEEAELQVEEYDAESEVYLQRYQQATKIYGWSSDENHSKEFRLFNIGLYLDGQEMEAKAEVKVSIIYKKIEEKENVDCRITHFGEKTEELEANLSKEDGQAVIDFETDHFSDFGVYFQEEESAGIRLLSAYNNSNLPANLIAYASFNGTAAIPQPHYREETGNARIDAHQNDSQNFGYVSLPPRAAGVITPSDQINYSLILESAANEYFDLKKAGSGYLMKGHNYNQFEVDIWFRPDPKPNGDTSDYGIMEIGGSSRNISFTGSANGKVLTISQRGGNSPVYTLEMGDENAIDHWTRINMKYLYDGTIVITLLDDKNYEMGMVSYPSGLSYDQLFEGNEILRFGQDAQGLQFNGIVDEVKVYASHYDSPTIPDGTIHPQTSKTYNLNARGVYLLNIDTRQQSGAPLEGVTYTVYRQDGSFVDSFTTTKEYTLNLTGLSQGVEYTIKQTGVPQGYIVADQTKTFIIPTGSDSVCEVGIFFDYAEGEGYASDKTAEVYDYEKRIYDIVMSSLSGLTSVSIDKKNFDFVVDQSNSMLFPAVLKASNAKVVLHYKNDGRNVTKNDASGNSERIDQALKAAGLPSDKVYYLVTDERTTSTVYAIWRSSNGHWYYQDASYYSQAQTGTYRPNSSEAYQYADVGHKNNTAIVDSGGCLDGVNRGSKGYVVGGGGTLERDLTNTAIGITNQKNNALDGDWYKTYTIYTGSEYNRLTYLKYALKRMVYQLASMGSQNTVTVTTFDRNLEACKTANIDAKHPEEMLDLIEFIDGIRTDGGTAQNYGLWHIVGRHASGYNQSGCAGNHLADENNFVIMITDGALNAAENTVSDTSDITDNTGNAKQKRDFYASAAAIRAQDPNVKIITIGLSVQNVDLAREILAARPGGIADPGMAFLDSDADKLTETLTNALLTDLLKLDVVDEYATIRDYISESFYPVDKAGNLLTDGQWLTLSGEPVNAGAANAAGQLHKDSKGWYVEWKHQLLKANNREKVNPWRGKIYIKAKEDFIGGNTIDTNKYPAEIDLLSKDGSVRDTIRLETPTVNVRLLPVNEFSSEETVFLGDRVNPEEKIELLEPLVYFTKIKNCDGSTQNKVDPQADDQDGTEKDKFYLNYAMGRELTEEEWRDILDGKTITIPYTFDEDSSHGPVGEFRIRLDKAPETVDARIHESTVAGKEVERYTLKIDYIAYRITGEGELEQRDENVHNYGKGAGTEVGSPGKNKVENGLGILTSENQHIVNVVDGKVTVKKEFAGDYISDQEEDFVFKLQKEDKDGNFVDLTDADGNLKTFTVTIPAGESSASDSLEHLARGKYRLLEILDGEMAEKYVLQQITSIEDESNCLHTTISDTEIHFTIGQDRKGEDLIFWQEEEGYHPVYSYLKSRQTIPSDEECFGVSYEAAKVVNQPASHSAEIPVEKKWKDLSASEYGRKQIYVVLTQEGNVITDADGFASAIVLNADNEWKGSFTVALPDRHSSLADLGYSVAELSNVMDESTEHSGKAHVLNAEDGTELPVIYYEKASDQGLIRVDDTYYKVTVAIQDGKTEGKDFSIEVTNSKAYKLPDSGGIGTNLYTSGGAALLLISLLLGFLLRRKRERRMM